MQSDYDETSVRELQQLALQTAQAFAAREDLSRRMTEEQRTLHDGFRAVLGIIDRINPETWSEEVFGKADELLANLIQSAERFLTRNVGSADSGQIQFFTDAIRRLREAREWLAQGCSPNPELRPSARELDDLGRESALVALHVIGSHDK